MAPSNLVITWILLSLSFFSIPTTTAVLRRNYYAKDCPNVESLVRKAVEAKFRQTFVTVPATLRLFFHDCLVQGCDASIMIASSAENKAEKDHPDNLSLAGDGFDTVIKAKAAVDAVAPCREKVSCADILAMAARDVVSLAGGPWYAVELGRVDGLTSTSRSVDGKLPQPFFGLNQLSSLLAPHGLTQTDIIALSGAHSVGFSHCNKLANRIYSFTRTRALDPTLNKSYASELRSMCPKNVDPTVAINMDPVTPRSFDNMYYRNLQEGKGLFTSDQTLYVDQRSRPTVDKWAGNSTAFFEAFVSAITKLGRIGAAGREGNTRRDCSAFN